MEDFLFPNLLDRWNQGFSSCSANSPACQVLLLGMVMEESQPWTRGLVNPVILSLSVSAFSAFLIAICLSCKLELLSDGK